MGVADCDAVEPTDGGLLVCCGGITTLGGGAEGVNDSPLLVDVFMYADDEVDVDCVSCSLTDGLLPLVCGDDSILHLLAGGASIGEQSINLSPCSI